VCPRHQGVHGRQAQAGVDGERIDLERCLGAEVCLGVGDVGRADVASLGVQDDQETSAAGRGDEPSQCAISPPPVAFVECRLRFDQSHGPHGGLERDVGESIEAVGGVPEPPGIEYGPRRVQSPHQRTPIGTYRREPGGEVVSHDAESRVPRAHEHCIGGRTTWRESAATDSRRSARRPRGVVLDGVRRPRRPINRLRPLLAPRVLDGKLFHVAHVRARTAGLVHDDHDRPGDVVEVHGIGRCGPCPSSTLPSRFRRHRRPPRRHRDRRSLPEATSATSVVEQLFAPRRRAHGTRQPSSQCPPWRRVPLADVRTPGGKQAMHASLPPAGGRAGSCDGGKARPSPAGASALSGRSPLFSPDERCLDEGACTAAGRSADFAGL